MSMNQLNTTLHRLIGLLLVTLAVLMGDLDFAEDAWSEVTRAAKDAVFKLLCVSPGCRMTPQGALACPWLQCNLGIE